MANIKLNNLENNTNQLQTLTEEESTKTVGGNPYGSPPDDFEAPDKWGYDEADDLYAPNGGNAYYS